MDNNNFIIREQSRYHYWRGAGLLSIKSFSNGQALYDIGQGLFRVDGDSYLILNHRQEYTIIIDSETEVSSFCVFFAEAFAEDVHRSLTHTTQRLLDDPAGASSPLGLFFERTYRHDLWLTPVLKQMQASFGLQQPAEGWLEEQYHALMQQLLLVRDQTMREVESVPAIRRATREELYRRLHLAHDYISASYHQPITLDIIARIACMSPNHLLRTFRRVFGQSPHQLLVDERLQHARRLLAMTKQSITEICVAVGFESLGSFSWLFRRRFGMSPQAFRSLNG